MTNDDIAVVQRALAPYVVLSFAEFVDRIDVESGYLIIPLGSETRKHEAIRDEVAHRLGDGWLVGLDGLTSSLSICRWTPEQLRTISPALARK